MWKSFSQTYRENERSRAVRGATKLLRNPCACICVCTCLREIGLSPWASDSIRTRSNRYATDRDTSKYNTEIEQCLRFKCCNVYGMYYSICVCCDAVACVIYNKNKCRCTDVEALAFSFSTPSRRHVSVLQCIMNTHRNEFKCLYVTKKKERKHLYTQGFALWNFYVPIQRTASMAHAQMGAQ